MNLSSEELKEVLTIFRAEAVDQIKILNSGLLELEKNPSNQSNIEEIFRTAHSIKGSSRMLGLEPIELISHELEDALGSVKNGKLSVDDHIDLMLESVDKIDEIIQTLSSSEKPDLGSVDVSDLVNRLKRLQDKDVAEAEASEDQPEKKKTKKAKKVEPEKETPKEPVDPAQAITEEIDANINTEVDTEEEPAADVAEDVDESAENESTGKRDTSADKDEIIRISIQQIDRIMNLVGELVTSKINNDQHIQSMYELKTHILLLFKAFDDYQGLVDSLDQMYQKATESISLEQFTENDIRNILRLVINTGKVIGPIHNKLTNMIQDQTNDVVRTASLIDQLQENVRDTRLLPLDTVLDLMPRMVRDISKHTSKKIELEIKGGETKLDKQILEEIKDPLIHIVRNCIDHGIESPDERVVNGKGASGLISINARYEGNSVLIEISDDGFGIDNQRIIKKAVEKKLISRSQVEQLSTKDIWNFIFAPGFSTSDIITDISGRGVGMDVVRTNVERLKGVISVDSVKGFGTSFQIRLPLTLATIQVLIVESHGEKYTIPVISISRLLQIELQDIEVINEKNYIKDGEDMISVMSLDDLLEKPRRFRLRDTNEIIIDEQNQEKVKPKLPVVVCHSAEKKVALIVESLIDEQEVVIKELGQQFKRVQNVMGTTILGSGELAIMLDPADLVKSAYSDKITIENINQSDDVETKKRVLVVDDSITTRTLEKNILEQAGYDVKIAVNGKEAWELLAVDSAFDIVVSDVEMPYMTGFELVSHIKKSSKLKHLPCILCTSLESETDKRKGVEAGANAYITKGSFNQRNLLETIDRLI